MRNMRIFACLLALALVGCATPGVSPRASATPGVTGRLLSAEATPPETATPSQPSQTPSGRTGGLEAFLPGGEGYTWVYSGFAEYGHRMTLRHIIPRGDRSIYVATGEVFDLSGGESTSDFSMSTLYIVEPDRLVERVSGPMLMQNRYRSLELLRTPVEKGTAWVQDVELVDGGYRTTLTSTITDVKDVDGRRTVFVTYTDNATGYEETREIAEGVGVVAYEKFYVPAGMDNEQGEMIGYRLVEGTSGAAWQLNTYLPPLNTQQTWFGLAEYGHTGKLVEVSRDDNGAVFRFDGVYQDGVGTPDRFAVEYTFNYVDGTVTERVLSNERTGEARLNSVISGLMVLKLPLYEGAEWSQSATLDGRPVTVEARVRRITDRGAVTVEYTVDGASGYYQDRYIEQRTYEPGLGMTGFSNLLPGDIGLSEEDAKDPAKVEQALVNHMFGYSLRRQ